MNSLRSAWTPSSPVRMNLRRRRSDGLKIGSNQRSRRASYISLSDWYKKPDRSPFEAARAGTLPTIALRRFNPEKQPWLPILHTQRGDRHYTAMFSNTARAHRLGMTRDWVIIYQDGDSGTRQYTIVTNHQGPLEGQRIVRGRESGVPRLLQGAIRPRSGSRARDVSGSGISVSVASARSNTLETDIAFSSATHTTFVASMVPASQVDVLPLAASKPAPLAWPGPSWIIAVFWRSRIDILRHSTQSGLKHSRGEQGRSARLGMEDRENRENRDWLPTNE